MKGEPTPIEYLRLLQRMVKRAKARRDLQRIVDTTRNSYECRRYREKRAAALKGR